MAGVSGRIGAERVHIRTKQELRIKCLLSRQTRGRARARNSAMITALIRSDVALDALAVTLAGLVPGVAEGLVADAVVLVGELREDVFFVAEAVGAKVVVASGAGSWAAGAKVARRE